MSLLTATLVDAEVPRGTRKDIRFQILDEEDNAFDLNFHTVRLWVYWPQDQKSLLVKDAIITDATEGEGKFEFIPVDTEDILAAAYDVSIFVQETGDSDNIWPVFFGRLAITPTAPREVEST